MAVCDLTITVGRKKVVDFTTPYMAVSNVVMMKKPGEADKTFRFLKPFHLYMWIGIIIAMMFTGLVTTIFSKISPLSDWNLSTPECVVDEVSFHENVWSALGSLLQQG